MAALSEANFPNPNFWNNKKVLVTGHTGFKGSWLTTWLESMGAIVCGLGLDPDTSPSLWSRLQADSKTVDIRQNINSSIWQKIVQDFQPEIAFHLAAQPLVVTGWEDPELTFKTNVGGLVEFLSWADSSKSLEVAVVVTSDKVYRLDNSKIPRKEDDPLGGDDPYSASKACAELVLHSWPKNRSLKIASARSGNVVGGGDWARDRLIPDLIREKHENEKFVSRNPKAIRPWQHVIEPLFGYLELGNKLNTDPKKYGQAFNFGPNTSDALSVEEMVNKSIENWGSGSYQPLIDTNSPHEAGLLKLDISKALNDLNWKPVFNAQTAVERTISWYKSYYNGIDAIELMQADIEYYKSKNYEQKH